MKKALIAAIGLITVMACSNNKEETGYIGPAEVKVENGVFTPEVLLSLGRLSDPQLSPDGTKILYGVSYNSVKDNRSCRNLFICNADGSGKVQLSRYAKSVAAARWSADGKSIWFLQGGQLWKAPYLGGKLGKKICMSKIPKGISDYSFSPDESRILYVSSIEGPVKQADRICPDLSKAEAYVTEDLMYRHWDHFVTETPRTYLATVEDGIVPEKSVDILGSEQPLYELPSEPFGGAEQLAWSPDGRYIAYSCRKRTGKEYAFSTNTGIYIYDTVSGETVTVSGNGGYDTNPVWNADGSKLAFISMERDGYEADRQRIMLADIAYEDGKPLPSALRELTVGFIYDAHDLAWTGDGKIVFPTTIDGIGAICSIDMDGTLRRLTPEGWLNNFGLPFMYEAKDGGISMLTSMTSMMMPTEIARIDISAEGEASLTQISHENDAILGQLAQIRQERIALKTAQGETLYSWVLYPAAFDPSKNYAGVEMFNGGPQTSLDQGWSYRWNFMLMAQQGYVVLLPNRHGDSGFGQPWKEQISGDYQGLNMQDYMLVGEWFKSQPWAGKLAGVGASYGGFSVYNMMGIHGDLFDCFISHAGIFDVEMMWYTTEESWFTNWDNGGLREFAYEPDKIGPAGDGITFGGLQQAGAPYADVAKTRYSYANDPESKVTKWHTPLLCIHGMKDYRIPYDQGMAAFNAAQMMGVPSKLILFPEENHWIVQPQNALFWHREFFDWLEKWL